MLIHPVFLEQFFPIACLLKSPLHTRLTYRRLSLGAHSTSQLSSINIWKTRECTTSSFNRVQQGTILIGTATGNILCILINTDEVTLLLVGIMLRHQVPMILFSPPRWTNIPCGHHQRWATWLDVTDNARCLVVSDVVLKNVVGFILSPVHVPCALVAIIVLIILWIVWQAKVVYSTTLMSVMFSTHYALNKTKIFLKRNKKKDFTS